MQDLLQGDSLRERHNSAAPEQEPQNQSGALQAGVSQQDAAAAATDDHQLHHATVVLLSLTPPPPAHV